MRDAFKNVSPSSSEPSWQPPSGGAGRLARLRHQERQWFAWLTILHERLTRDGQGPVSEESRRVLEIAKKRWLQAKAALHESRQVTGFSAGNDPQSDPESAPCTDRADS